MMCPEAGKRLLDQKLLVPFDGPKPGEQTVMCAVCTGGTDGPVYELEHTSHLRYSPYTGEPHKQGFDADCPGCWANWVEVKRLNE